MAYLDNIEKLERQDSWSTTDDSLSDVSSEGETWSSYKNPLKNIRIGGRRRRSLFRFARSSRHLHRLGCLLLVLAGVQAYLLHRDYLDALAAKYSPTTFARISTYDQHFLADPRWNLDAPHQPEIRNVVLENRAQWKKLGSGFEGKTFALDEAVIKVFNTNQSPLRNCVPGARDHLAWPSEIPVSLLLGGLANDERTLIRDDAHFVPILDYFFLPNDDGNNDGNWHLVTPFLHSGTLDHLAKRLRSHEPALTTSEIDAHFRPSFHRILEALDIMHSRYDLCHDDVKMDNIFVMNYTYPPHELSRITNNSIGNERDTHWLLADLGNARQPSHPYHVSRLWAHDNGQHPDCRVNDLRRLAKSYILFLQAATKRSADNKARFVEGFVQGSTPWSKLYWYTMNAEVSAREIHDHSKRAFSPVDAEGNTIVSSETFDGEDETQRLARPNLGGAWFDHAWLGIDQQSRRVWSASRELSRGLGLSERWANLFGKIGIWNTPVSRRC